MTTRLLRVEEAAEMLALKPATIRKLLSRRELVGVKPTRRSIRIRLEDVQALMRVGWRPRTTGEPKSAAAGSSEREGGFR